jgi:enoyl-CoA hydratase/carnithine racemase
MAAAEFAYVRFLNRHSQPLASPLRRGLSARKGAENSALDNKVLVNQSIAHTELIATFRRAEADAAHKFGLIKGVEKKGPKAIQAAVETAAKAAKRRDSLAKKLNVLGVSLKD